MCETTGVAETGVMILIYDLLDLTDEPPYLWLITPVSGGYTVTNIEYIIIPYLGDFVIKIVKFLINDWLGLTYNCGIYQNT